MKRSGSNQFHKPQTQRVHIEQENLTNLRRITNHGEVMNNEIEVGIDEAGRGPVFGPMVYAGVAWPIRCRADFARLGFADSKEVSPEDREVLFKLIEEFDDKLLHKKSVICSTLELTAKQLSFNKESLNTYSHNCAISIIRHFLGLGLKVTRAYLDTVGDEVKYRQLLEREFDYLTHKIEFTVCSKADSKFPVVSAASIVAKVTRDDQVKNIVIREPIEVVREFGSGYPGDPKTVKWLNDHFDPVFGYPQSAVRFSWSTVTKRLEDAKLEYEFLSSVDLKRFDLAKSFREGEDRSKLNTKHRGALSNRLNLQERFEL